MSGLNRRLTHRVPKSFDASQYKIVLGYDFGTTFSGCAYAYSAQNEEVFDISKWCVYLSALLECLPLDFTCAAF